MRPWCSRAVYDRKCWVPATLSAHQQHCIPTGRPLIRIWQVPLGSLFLLFSAEELAQMRRCWRSDSLDHKHRELREALSWPTTRIDCERVVNWAVIIRTLTKVFVHPWHLCQTARAGLKLGLCALLPFPLYFLSGQQQIWSGILKCYCTTNTSTCVPWALVASYLSVQTFSILRTEWFVVHLTHKMSRRTTILSKWSSVLKLILIPANKNIDAASVLMSQCNIHVLIGSQ